MDVMAPNEYAKKVAEQFGTGVSVALALLLMSWGIWVTTSIYSLGTNLEAGKMARTTQFGALCTDIDDLKRLVESQARDIKNLQTIVFQSNERMMDRLNELNKKR